MISSTDHFITINYPPADDQRKAENKKKASKENGKSLLKKLQSFNIFRRVMPTVSFRVNPEHGKLTQLVSGLFICGVSGLNATNIRDIGITHIINATTEVPNLRSLGNIQRTKLWLEDTPQSYIYPHLELHSDQIEAIIADGGKVLVHCVCGVSRSASICLAFLTKHRCRSLREAYHLMDAKRPLVRPNLGFWRQLIAYERDVKQNNGSVRLVRDECQDDKLLPDVYLPIAIPDYNKLSEEKPNAANVRQVAQKATIIKSRFQPVLEPVMELVEATA